jgi:hypothetical protein
MDQLLDRLATSAHERASASKEPGEKDKYRRIARLSRELLEALGEEPGPGAVSKRPPG